MQDKINVEIVYATPEEQKSLKFLLNLHSTIRDALIKFNIPNNQINTINVGIFGKLRNIDFVLQDGDRVEIYSPLLIDPKIARAQRAERDRRAKHMAKR